MGVSTTIEDLETLHFKDCNGFTLSFTRSQQNKNRLRLWLLAGNSLCIRRDYNYKACNLSLGFYISQQFALNDTEKIASVRFSSLRFDRPKAPADRARRFEVCQIDIASPSRGLLPS